MRSTVEEINSVQRRVKVECAPEDVQNAFTKAYQNIQKKAEIKGFRRGKAPVSMIKKLYGGAVAHDVAHDLIKMHLFRAIADEKLNPITAPVLETQDLPVEGEGFAFSAVVDLMPQINIEGYKGLKLEIKPFVVDDTAVEKEITSLRKRSAQARDVPEGTFSENGHLITFSQKAFDENGIEISQFDAHDIPVELGTEQLFAELEAALMGVTVGTEREVSINLPKDFGDQELAGRLIKFQLALTKIQALDIPELDDEFAKDVGFDNLDLLKADVHRRMSWEAKNHRHLQLENAILSQLGAKYEFDVPPAIVDQVIDSLINDIPKRRQTPNMIQDQAVRARFRDEARSRAKNTLILIDIIKKEQISINDDDVVRHVREILTLNNPTEPKPEVIEQVVKTFPTGEREKLLFLKAVDWIIDQAEITELS